MSVKENKIIIKKVLGHKKWIEVEVVEGSAEHKAIIVWNRAMNYTINQDRKELKKQNEREEMEISSDALYEESGYEIPDTDSLSPSEYYMRQALYAEVREAVAQLKKRQKELVIMHYFQDMSQVEIASRLHITEGTVSLTLERAYNNLRKILKKD